VSAPVPAAAPAPAPTVGGGPVTTLAYLGPEGSFTHQAATGWSGAETMLVPLRTVPEVFAAVASGEASHGVVAIESSVEGYVVPSLDAIVSAPEVVAVDEAFVPITFDAFVLPGSDVAPQHATAHPHGLAQCQGFVDRHGLLPVPASSNAAACRDIQPGQVALGPPLCDRLADRLWTVGAGRTLATADHAVVFSCTDDGLNRFEMIEQLDLLVFVEFGGPRPVADQ